MIGIFSEKKLHFATSQFKKSNKNIICCVSGECRGFRVIKSSFIVIT
jgi:hypothetical protein